MMDDTGSHKNVVAKLVRVMHRGMSGSVAFESNVSMPTSYDGYSAHSCEIARRVRVYAIGHR
jgi:hypothetical protein